MIGDAGAFSVSRASGRPVRIRVASSRRRAYASAVCRPGFGEGRTSKPRQSSFCKTREAFRCFRRAFPLAGGATKSFHGNRLNAKRKLLSCELAMFVQFYGGCLVLPGGPNSANCFAAARRRPDPHLRRTNCFVSKSWRCGP